MSLILVRYVLMAAVRDRLLWAMLIVSILGVCLSIFSASAAIIEQGQFVLTYMASGLRIILLMGLTLFTVFFVRRSFDSRDVEFLLTRPLSRRNFVFSQSLAFSLLALACGVFLSLVIAALSSRYEAIQGLFLWSFGVTFEFILIANVAFFFAMILSSPVSAGMATFGFYILARLMGQLLSIVHHGGAAGLPDIVGKTLGLIMQLISVFIPRLDLMAQTSWLIYGGGEINDWLFIVMQSAAFLALITLATYFDLKRRQF